MCRDQIKKAKALMEQNLVRDVKNKTKRNKNKQTNKTNKHNTRQIAQSNRKATYLEC